MSVKTEEEVSAQVPAEDFQALEEPLEAFFPSRSHRKGMAKSIFGEYITVAVS